MIEVYVDGLCEPKNPGGTGTCGFAIFEDGKEIGAGATVIGSGPKISNNVAEYRALKSALERLIELGRRDEEIIVRSDSRLVVNQMSGNWNANAGLYIGSYLAALELAKKFRHISYEWIPRGLNQGADGLSREAYEAWCLSRGVKPIYHKEHGRQRADE